jgi:hypothetical protein
VANARADSGGRRPRYRADSRKARSSVDTALAPRSYPTAINGLNSAGHQPLPFAIIWNVGAACRRGFRWIVLGLLQLVKVSHALAIGGALAMALVAAI